MIKLVKRFLYKILGRSSYLKILHLGFKFLFNLNLLKNSETEKYNYFAKKIINEGDCVIDIGANLGYFSVIFSNLVGKKGKLICIEPVKPFFEVLQWALKNKSNTVLYNYALGNENKMVELVLPKFEGVFRTGLSHIPNDESEKVNSYIFETEMVQGSKLLNDLPRIDYIKCDIEGYEGIVLSELKEILNKYRPVLQVEIWDNQKKNVLELLTGIGYIPFTLNKNILEEDFEASKNDGDILFIHQEKRSKFNHLITNTSK